MLTVRDLFNRVAWEDVAFSIEMLYPDSAGDLPWLQEVFEEAKSCVPSGNPEEMTIRISWREDEEGGYFDVTGFVSGDDWSSNLRPG